jgi:hypothetical protein
MKVNVREASGKMKAEFRMTLLPGDRKEKKKGLQIGVQPFCMQWDEGKDEGNR